MYMIGTSHTRKNAPELGASFLCPCVLWRLSVNSSVIARAGYMWCPWRDFFFKCWEMHKKYWAHEFMVWYHEHLNVSDSSCLLLDSRSYPELKIPVQEIGYLWLTDIWYLVIHDTLRSSDFCITMHVLMSDLEKKILLLQSHHNSFIHSFIHSFIRSFSKTTTKISISLLEQKSSHI